MCVGTFFYKICLASLCAQYQSCLIFSSLPQEGNFTNEDKSLAGCLARHFAQLFPHMCSRLTGYSPKENLKNVTVYHPEKFISDISINFHSEYKKNDML